MKILYVATISNTVNAFLIPHIEFLTKQGHEVYVACNIIGEISPELVRLGCKVFNIEFQRSPLKKDNYIAYKKIKKLVLTGNYNLVHTHTPVASFITRLACRKIPNLKVLYTAHGFHFFEGASFKSWLVYYTLEKLAARWTDGLITINQEDYDSAKRIKLRKLNSIYKVHGVGISLTKYSPQTYEEKSNLRKEYGYCNNDFILLYAAELNHNKNQGLLINVVKVLKDRGINVKLLLAGNGVLEAQYKELSCKLGLTDNVIFLGFRKDIPSLLKLSDISVASSRREGLPVNVMEAMASGLPLIVTNCRGNRDLVIDNQNGYVIGLEDTEGYASAVEALYKSMDLRHKFGSESLRLVETCSLDNIIKEMAEIYSNFI